MRILFLLCALPACPGCGTVVNLAVPSGEPRVYGGVRTDVTAIEKLVESGTPASGPLDPPGSGAGALLALAFLVLPVLDLPLSLLADTLALPLTRWLDSH